MKTLALARAVGTAPGKLLLVGEHAVVHGQPAFALPFPAVQAEAVVEPAERMWLDTPLYAGPLEGAPPILLGLVDVIRAMAEGQSLRVTLRSTIPTGAGLGSSAAVAAALVRGLADALGTAPDVEALVHLAETHAHGNPSGVDGRVVVRQEPIAFRRGQADSPRVPTGGRFWLVVAHSGRARDTRGAVAAVAGLFEREPARAGAICERLGRLTEAAMAGWSRGDAPAVGVALDEAQGLLAELGVSAPVLDRLVAAARGAGALGAKLTGAGLGGCMLALAADEAGAARVAEALRAAGASEVWQHTYE